MGAPSGGAADPSVPAADVPAPTSDATGGAPYSTAPQKRSARPVLTIFSATASALNAGSPVVRFQVTDRAARVRVRLAFVNLYLVVNSTQIVRASGLNLRHADSTSESR